jgi:hypothetical protein
LVANESAYDVFVDSTKTCLLSARPTAPSIKADSLEFISKLAPTPVKLNPTMKFTEFEELEGLVSIVSLYLDDHKQREILSLSLNIIFEEFGRFLDAGVVPVERIEKQVIVMLPYQKKKCVSLVKKYPSLVRTRTLIKM